MPRLDTDEGLEPSALPNDPNEGIAAGPSRLGESGAQDVVNLSQGDAFTVDEAAALMGSRSQRVITILGERGAGKTTLLAELHQAFLRGPFGGLLFGGSETMIAFEKRCALGRTVSRQKTASTTRTPLTDGVRLLHLAVRDESLKAPMHELLLTDVSGELAKNARKSASDAKELSPIVRGSRRIALVVDGAKIADPNQRQRVRANAKTLLRALLEAGGIYKNSAVDIVLNKWDYVAGDAAIEAFVEDTLNEAAALLAPDVATVSIHRIAVRIKPGASLERWHGLPRLLREWTTCQSWVTDTSADRMIRYERAYLNYGYRNG